MKNVIYYNAGAGSGKTYTLTHLLADKIREGVNPSEVILTTFTIKAADDLRARARAVLYEQGLPDRAALLDQASIGTVHSLGEKFIGKFWYLLGLSPNMNVMDEEATEHYTNRSLATLPSDEDIREFMAFFHTFEVVKNVGNKWMPDKDYWKKWLKEVIDMATTYRVTDMKKSVDESLYRMRAILKPCYSLPADLSPYDIIFDTVLIADGSDTRDAARGRVKLANKFKAIKKWLIRDYIELGGFLGKLPKGIQKKIPGFDDLAAPVQNVLHSYEVFSLVESVVRRIFDIARRWLDQYNAFKAEHRILDFNDMERYFVQLLQNPDCEKEIRGRYKLLMVDEFQDSSPVQVDIFNRLSEMVEQSYWCGDSKQAIYGFRGADTVLTEAVVDMIEAESKDNIRHLDTSYRSEPDIVEQCNRIFCKAFEGLLPADRVRLKTHRKKTSAGPSLMHWVSANNKKEDYFSELPRRIKKFAAQYDIPWKDIAVLARKNDELDIVACALQKAFIPVNFTTGALNAQKEVELIKAVLTLVVEPSNPLAKAKIVWLSDPDFSLAGMIDSRMAEQAELARYKQEREQADDPDSVERPLSWLLDNPLIAKIMERRDRWQDQGVASLIETIMVELNLRSVMKSWEGNWKQREDNVYLLCENALRYENLCRTMAIGASINGFLNRLDSTEAACAGDSEGVVLSTYHKSKGLEWPNVILLSLDFDPAKEENLVKRGIFGIHEMRRCAPSRDNLFPEVTILLMPNLFQGNTKVAVDINSQIVESEDYKEARKREIAEATRRLYVGMTRGRDRVITYARGKKNASDNYMVAFTSLGIDIRMPPEGVLEADIFGTEISVTLGYGEEVVETEAGGAVLAAHEHDLDTSSVASCEYPDRYVSPSKATPDAEVKAEVVARSGKRIELRGKPEMNRVGDCIHNSFAAFGTDPAHNLAVVDGIVKAFGFDAVLPDRQAIVDAYEWLCGRLTQEFSKAKAVYHELPFMHATGKQIVRGSIDFIWETADGCVLVDFKTYPGRETDVTDPAGAHYAGNYGGQFECYRQAIAATRRPILASYVYYPIAGLLVKLER